jgi:hypothetical protein
VTREVDRQRVDVERGQPDQHALGEKGSARLEELTVTEAGHAGEFVPSRGIGLEERRRVDDVHGMGLDSIPGRRARRRCARGLVVSGEA